MTVLPDDDQREHDDQVDAASQARAHAALDAIDARQAHLPRCTLCGQRTRKLDAFGLCSKTSQAHADARSQSRRTGGFF